MFARLLLLAVAALKFGKLSGTLITMLISIGVYAMVFGWRYAVGIVAMLFLHEMGHYIAAVQRGIKVRLPMFIPFAFAWVRLEESPHDAETEAYIGLAGPMLGTVAAIGAYFLARNAATCPSERNGELSEMPGNGASLSSMCAHGPSRVCSVTTTASRSGSMAGLVTCANR